MASIVSFWRHTQVKLLCIYFKIIHSSLFIAKIEAGKGIILRPAT